MRASQQPFSLRRLKIVADVRPSGVDKLTLDGEQSVSLCNYVDVYKNSRISSALSFMQASATPAEVERFTLQAGDVLITKDSETPDDIAAAALVEESAAGVVCGYHLALLRPKGICRGDYLYWCLSSPETLSQFSTRAQGITRFGLTVSSIGEILVPMPPASSQRAIASFLDRETGKIDALVGEQERLIALLKEKRQAVISQAVTKGLNPSVSMKDSGVKWLGKLPAHWNLVPVKQLMNILDGRRLPLSAEERSFRQGEYPYYGASGAIDSIDDYIFDEDLILVSEDGANLLARSTPIAFVARGRYWVNNHAHILQAKDGLSEFWASLIESIDLAPFVTGSAQPKLTIEALANLRLPAPPSFEERAAISTFISCEIAAIRALREDAERAIVLLRERRAALIAAAVTGKIDVREHAEMPSAQAA